MSYRWHSQRQGKTDAIRLTWIIIKTKKKTNRRRKKKNINMSPFDCIEKWWKKREDYIGHSQHKSLSYLHESQCNLCLEKNKNYIKIKMKNENL